MLENKHAYLPHWHALATTACIACFAKLINTLNFPPFTLSDGAHPIDSSAWAIICAICLNRMLPLPLTTQSGAKKLVTMFLPIAIILLGANIDFINILQLGSAYIWMCSGGIVGILLFSYWYSLRLKLDMRLGILLGAGTAICGASAIAAIAPVIKARSSDIALSVAIVTIIGSVAIFAFPLMAAFLGMSQKDGGAWIGASVQATPQVLAAGFAYGQSAGEIGIIVKMVRVLLLTPVLLFLSSVMLWKKRSELHGESNESSQKIRWSQFIPPFIIGFTCLALANSLKFFPSVDLHFQGGLLWEPMNYTFSLSRLAKAVSSFLILMCMAGIGLTLELSTFSRASLKPFLLGMSTAIILALFSYMTIIFQ